MDWWKRDVLCHPLFEAANWHPDLELCRDSLAVMFKRMKMHLHGSASHFCGYSQKYPSVLLWDFRIVVPIRPV
jgi:hypothetical protein